MFDLFMFVLFEIQQIPVMSFYVLEYSKGTDIKICKLWLYPGLKKSCWLKNQICF